MTRWHVVIVLWLTVAAPLTWRATSLALHTDASVADEQRRVRSRAIDQWSGLVSAKMPRDSATAAVLEATKADLSDQPSRLLAPFLATVDTEALWASAMLNPIRDARLTMPRVAAESLSLRVDRAQFNMLFYQYRATFEARASRRNRSGYALAAGAWLIGGVLWFRRPRRGVALLLT